MEAIPRWQAAGGADSSSRAQLGCEVLFLGNTPGEMSRKLREYLDAGVELVWYVDPRARTVTVYTGLSHSVLLRENDPLTGGDLLPGFELSMAELFAELDEGA